jgi:glycosyltransferase involved in cell wall biosynthesis
MPFTNFINKKSDFILVPTAIHKDYQISKWVNKDKIIFFPNVTNLDWSYNKDNIKNIKDKYWLEDKKVILFVGRLIKLKWVQYLINAYYNLLIEKDYLKENIILLIVWEGDYKKELIELSNKILDIWWNIIFLWKINNNELNDYYEISDFWVIPSINYNWISDAYALVVNEFLVHWKPVIVSNMVWASWIIKLHSEFWYIVEEKSSNDLKEKIYKLLSINNSDSLTLNIKEIINKYNSYEKWLKILENIFLIK